jgi:primase-polymerase (primpol)-like protein
MDQMSRQVYTTTQVANIPQELRDTPQWLAYRTEPRPDGRLNKIPIDAKTGKAGSSTEPETWSTYELAAKRSPVGAGFVLTRDDCYFAIDLDDCVDPKSGEVSPRAQAIVDRFPMYWEVSYSGTGLRGIGRGVIPGDRCRTGKIEVYDHDRYVVMTGRTLPGHATIRNCQAELTSWYREVFPPQAETPPPAGSAASPTADDAALLERIRGSKQGPAFIALFDRGELTAHGDDHSGADLALMNQLRYWTGADSARMERLFTTSALGQRQKWQRADYRRRTIERALPGETWTPPQTQPPPGRRADPPPTGARQDTTVAAGMCAADLAVALARITDLEATIVHQASTIETREGVIVRERELRIAAEARANRLGFERSSLMQVLRNPDLAAGPKLTHFATILDLGARIANGEAQTPAGFRLPAKRIADNTGQKVAAVRRHWNEAATCKLLTKTNVRETTEREGVDPETGEILTVAGLRDVTHIHVPEDNITLLITPIASHRKAEPETRGGKREPRCKNHPDAPTITTSITVCSECDVEIDRKITVHQPESSATVFAPDTSVAIKSFNATVFAPDPNPASDPAPRSGSASNFEPEPPDPWTPPPDHWASPYPGRPGFDRWTG